MVNNAGGGYSRFKDLALTRWREDTSCNNWGTFCYVRDLQNGDFWSTTHQPTLKEASHYEAIFSQGRVEFRRIDNGIELHTEIVVSPEDNVEIRRWRHWTQAPQCGFSQAAIQILGACGVKSLFTVNVLEEPEIRQGIKEFANWPTIPQLYVKGEFVGGSDIVKEMYQSGELQKLLEGLRQQA